ncbi:hypothetical protein Egran_04776 [Elaphomyces granulatus]|uniref:Low temperature viability protein n=1 Tax=Elaphomyces granulatus TaxID=519963 RepID=A0A232LUE0_9EURO|nr:hypothetical protein Egran_04776 [Elaphomyces granulatus]
MPPRRQWIDKKSATKYQLFHRSQYDPLIHDPEADDRVLYQVSGPAPAEQGSSGSQKPSRNLADLEKEFESESVRENEGEAANYGIFYDDSEYDYMQHLRELGTNSGNAYFVEAAPTKGKGKGKAVKLEDALRGVSLDDSLSELAAKSVYEAEHASTYARSSASSYLRKPTYQDQQNVPDSIAGLQPNMDPRLREVLEALDDDAYVDDDDTRDVFGELAQSAQEIEPGEWEDTLFDDVDDGGESDATEKVPKHQSTVKDVSSSDSDDETGGVSIREEDPVTIPDHDKPVPDTAPEHGEWMKEFAKYKKDAKSVKPPAAVAENASERRTAASTLFTVGGTPIRQKKRKGALTNPSAYSMTSSSLARTEGLRLLDDRFERIEALYSVDEEGTEYDADGTSMISGMTGTSGVSLQAPSLVSRGSQGVPLRSDFDEVMDGFLAGWQDRSSQAKRKGARGKRGKNGNEAVGIKMLDEIRQSLGPARIPGKVSGGT